MRGGCQEFDEAQVLGFFCTLGISYTSPGLKTDYLGQFIVFGRKQFSYKAASRIPVLLTYMLMSNCNPMHI